MEGRVRYNLAAKLAVDHHMTQWPQSRHQALSCDARHRSSLPRQNACILFYKMLFSGNVNREMTEDSENILLEL